MSVWYCPHCKSVQIVTGDAISDFQCNKFNCGAILDRLDEPDAGRATREAFYVFDHGFTPVEQQVEGLRAVNRGLARMAQTIREIP